MKTILAVSSASFALLLLAAPGTSRADNIFVSDSGYNTIEEFDSSGSGSIFASSVNNPRALAFDASGNLYVGDFNAGGTAIRIEEFNTNGTRSVFSTYHPSGLVVSPDPQVMAFDNNGNLYAAYTWLSTIVKINTQGVATVFATYPSSGLSGVSGLAFDNSGNLFVSSAQNNSIYEFHTNGTESVFASASSGLHLPGGIAFDRSGNLYVANWGQNLSQGYIEKFGTNGVGSSFGSADLFMPEGVAFDSSGNLYVAIEGSGLPGSAAIVEFDSSGNESIFSTTGLKDPWAIAIEIPEPSTYAMVATGIGAVLAGLRLRRPSS